MSSFELSVDSGALDDGNSAKIIGKKLHESSDSDGVEDTFPPYAVIRKPSKTFGMYDSIYLCCLANE